MRYANILDFDVCNGEGIGITLFVQGCHFHCSGCFNPESWDFNGGKEWTKEVHDYLISLIDRPYIKRFSLLGGECLADENVEDVYNLIKEVKERFPDKNIWLYTGYSLPDIMLYEEYTEKEPDEITLIRQSTISLCDVVVDGQYVDELKDLTLRFRGSSNQNIWKKQGDGFVNTTKVCELNV